VPAENEESIQNRRQQRARRSAPCLFVIRRRKLELSDCVSVFSCLLGKAECRLHASVRHRQVLLVF